MGPEEQSLTLFVLFLPFIAAAVAPLLTRVAGHNAAWLLALAPLFIFVHFVSFLPLVAAGNTVAAGYDWIPSLGARFSWYLDGLSLTFALLISGIGTLIVIYSGGYLKGHQHQGRFFSFILMFMGAMQGLVVSDSFLMLFVFWELTSITSFLLIGFDHVREASRRAAIQALLVTGLGGLSMLAGLLVVAAATGQMELSGLLSAGDVMRQSPFYVAALLLLLGGAFTKSAQFPFHFWLPNAMEAPTPVSAYLHSATMVKAGVYLVMRLNPAFGETVLWETILPLFGGVTLLVGTVLAVRQTDLKLMLAYTTVASLGLLVMLTGIGSEMAVEAAVLYLIAHSMFKGTLFMAAGTIDHETGTRDIRRLAGLRKAMPLTFGAALLAAISMGGLPPMFGFLAKEEIYAALGFADAWTATLTIAAILGNALMFVIAFAVGLKPFRGSLLPGLERAHEGSVLLWLGPAVLSLAGIATALGSAWTHSNLSDPMASAVAGQPVSTTISVVPHIGVPLLLSAITVALGVVLYMQIDRLRALLARLAFGWGPDRGFDQAVSGIIRVSKRVTDFFQSGRMDIYMTMTFIAIAVALLLTPILFDEMPSMPEFPDLALYEWAVLVVAIAGLWSVLSANNRLTAIVSLGVQGFAVALLFVLTGAPDLAFTQFMVETLSVVILALVMTRLRLSPSDHRPMREKLIDAAVALACGTGFGLFLLRVTQGQFDFALSDFFARYSYTIAHGRNEVNVILVDFRGLDTLGEITVVMVAGLAILALIRVRTRRGGVISARSEDS